MLFSPLLLSLSVCDVLIVTVASIIAVIAATIAIVTVIATTIVGVSISTAMIAMIDKDIEPKDNDYGNLKHFFHRTEKISGDVWHITIPFYFQNHINNYDKPLFL